MVAACDDAHHCPPGFCQAVTVLLQAEQPIFNGVGKSGVKHSLVIDNENRFHYNEFKPAVKQETPAANGLRVWVAFDLQTD
jgi:hypothetical protein